MDSFVNFILEILCFIIGCLIGWAACSLRNKWGNND